MSSLFGVPNPERLIQRPVPETHGVGILRGPLDRDPLVFDATIESVFSAASEVTSSPVEDGSSVSDHRRTHPTSWRFRSIFVADNPDPRIAQQRAQAARDDGDDPLESARKNGPQENPLRATQLMDELLKINKTGEPVTVYTDMGRFENALIENLSYRVLASRRDPQKGDVPTAIEVSGTFREVRFASTETVELPAEERKKTAQKTKKQGNKTTKPIKDDDPVKAKAKKAASFAHQLIN